MYSSSLHKLKSTLFYSVITMLLSLSFSALSQDESENIDLPVVPAQYADVEQERMLDGLVETVHKTTVSAQTSGQVSDIYYDVDDYVKKGEVLLRLRDKDQQAKVKAAQSDFNQAKIEFNRMQEIYAKKLVAKSSVDKAEAQLKSTSARLEQARENLEHTVVRAPYSGIVMKRHIEIGEVARPGVALFTGLSLESLRVVVNLPQDIINSVRQQKQARVLMLNDGIASINISTMMISPFADTESHTFLVRGNFPAGDHGLYPGMAVKVAFVIGKVRKLVVPFSAISHRSEVTAVYILDAEQNISMRQIRVGHKIAGFRDNGGMIEVLSGLDEHERVITEPIKAVAYLKEQQSINKK